MKGVKGKAGHPGLSFPLLVPQKRVRLPYQKRGAANGKYNGNDPMSGMQR
jgi:hypothetical protein